MRHCRTILVSLLCCTTFACAEEAEDDPLCQTADDCPEGQLCGSDGACRSADCTRDFDCPAGYLCNEAGSCMEASADEEREFGEVTLDFSSGSEQYLLGVFAMPTGQAEVQADYVQFTLDAGGAPSGALRPAPAGRRIDYSVDREAWRAQMALDAKRRDGIDRLVQGVRDGERALVPGVTKQASCGGCNEGEVCWHGSCTENPILTFTDRTTQLTCAVLGAVGTGDFEVTVLLDQDDDSGNARDASLAAATEFATAAGEALELFDLSEHSGNLDRDGDGEMTVVFSSKLTDLGVVGYFDFQDYLPAGDGEATGNEADLLWALVPSLQTSSECPAGGCDSTVVTQEVAVGTLVHEYTHLVTFAERVYGAGATPADNEVLWLDEGLAHLMEDLTGWGASTIGPAIVALDEWPSTTFASAQDTVAQRGQAMLLLRHLIDDEGRSQGATDAKEAAQNVKLHSILLGEQDRGFLHPTLRQRGADGIWKWLLATYATNNPEVEIQAAQDDAYLPRSIVTATGQETGFDPFGSYTDARGVAIDLYGPVLGDGSTDVLTDLSVPFSSELLAAGSVLFIVSEGEAPLTITGTGQAAADLRLFAQRVK